MTRAEREFDIALLLVGVPMVVVVGAFIAWAVLVHPSPVSSPGDGRVPAVTDTAGTTSP